MTVTDKCHIMSVANDIGAKYFENKEISPDMQIGALRAIRELVTLSARNRRTITVLIR